MDGMRWGEREEASEVKLGLEVNKEQKHTLVQRQQQQSFLMQNKSIITIKS